MKKFWRIFWIVVVVAALALTFYFLYKKTTPEKVVYELVEPKRDTVRQSVIATGRVEPRDEVLIKPQIQGIISSLHKEAGQMVRSGEVIATVKVIPDMSQLNSAESRVTQAGITLEQAEREFRRTQTLFDAKAISTEEFEKAQSALMGTREDYQSAIDNRDIIRDGIISRYAEMSSTQIRSTINGMILDVPVKVGNSVIPSNTFNEGTTVASVADMNDMLFRGNVDETDVGKLREGIPVKITIGAIQDAELDAELEYISPKAIVENNVIMFEVKAAVRNKGDLFVRAGYSANADIMIESHEDVLTVPESVIEFEGEKTYVQLLTSALDADEQTFERREVKVGLSDGIKIEILEGLTTEDRVRGAIKSKDEGKKEITVSAN